MQVRRSSILVLLAAASTLLAEERVEFNRDIRPIFSDTCFACHGPDEAKTKGKLRLDSLEAARRGGKSGDPAIVPGHPERSAVMKRLLTTDADDHMPPAEFHKVLSKDQIELVGRWIKEGAVYQGHWAFQTPKKPAVPTIPTGGNAIDGFVAQVRTAKGLSGTPEASRPTLLRRAALDLTGLPPTEADLAAFLADTSPDAWSKAIDRLLASPHYGERMAAQWLDFARYADSNGFQSDTTRTMWPWRDWVIRAYNTNKPFNAFTVEQLAGDLLPNATEDQIIATGFNRNHRLNGEGGRIVAEWAVETVIDRVETTGSTWMALTMNCCRCHDHKYDPISQKSSTNSLLILIPTKNRVSLANSVGLPRPVRAVTPPDLLLRHARSQGPPCRSRKGHRCRRTSGEVRRQSCPRGADCLGAKTTPRICRQDRDLGHADWHASRQ